MFKIFPALIFVSSILSGGASAASLCDSKVTRELENCAKSNFEVADQALNKTYKEVASKLPDSERLLLMNAQRKWIKYKGSICKEAYETTSPGQEAGIDRWTCLDQMTRARTGEINYIETGTGGDDFYHALDIVSRYYEHGDRNRFVSKLVLDAAKDDNYDWQSYVRDNCALAVRRIREERDTCIARQQFYRY